ncbi:MAG TPA: MarR family transcriptional regulator [Burkholderiaceae bacterium]|nr:MarR family transcriptional regulator [Burkholderiaceae bacterium]
MASTPITQRVDPTPDLESRVRPDDHADLRLWLRLLTCSTLIEHHVRTGLRLDYQTTLPRFDLMAQLERVPEGMTMSDLSRHMMVTNGNITGITDQLEKEGLVERNKIKTDRRSSIVKLTPKGQRQFKKMAQSHEKWVQALFVGLPDETQSRLLSGLGQLKEIIRGNLPPKP